MCFWQCDISIVLFGSMEKKVTLYFVMNYEGTDQNLATNLQDNMVHDY